MAAINECKKRIKLLINNKLVTIGLFPLLIFASGCSTHVSTRHGYDYGHRGHLDVGVHGNSKGAAVVGALIVGGIIGSIITEAENEKKLADQNKQHNSLESNRILSNNNALQSENFENQPISYEEKLATNSTVVEWFQVGKDGECYLMSVSNGVTDVVSHTDAKNCEQN